MGGRLVRRWPPTDRDTRGLRLQPAGSPVPTWPQNTAHPVDLSAFREGEHQLQAVIKDAAGNPPTAGPKTITIDRTAPGPPGRADRGRRRRLPRDQQLRRDLD